MANEIKYLGADGTSRLVYYIKQRQPMITSVAKLSADLVEDGTTNKVFTATEQTKLSGIASGAQVNVLESVKVNGSALTISSKAVDVLMKSIDSTNTTAQATSSSEAIDGSGTINLHKIAKTGTYSDLIGTPTLGTASALDTGTSQGNIPVLGTNGKLPSSVVPASAITDTFVASSQASMLALSSAEVGDICVRTDLNKTFILKAEPYSTLANWQELLTPTDAVLSVNGQTGAVSLSASDVGAVPTTRTVNSKALSSDITLSASDVGAEPAFNKNTAFNQNFETSTSNIKMNGTVSVGSSSNIARADHVHPSDTSKMDVSNPTGTGSLSLNRYPSSTIGTNSVAVGTNCYATGSNSFSGGDTSTASGGNSFAFGSGAVAGGNGSIAVGNGATTTKAYSQAFGNRVIADTAFQMVFGVANIQDTEGKYVEVVGNGDENAITRSNARTLDWSGNEILAGTSQATGFKTASGTSSQFLKADGSTDSTSYATQSEVDNLPDTAITTSEIDALFS